MRKMHNEQGMTLLEVMVAMAIFSCAALALMNTVTVSSHYTLQLGETLRASWVAENQMAEARLTRRTFTDQPSGNEEIGGQTWYWQARLAQMPSGVKVNEVIVFREGEEEHPLVTLRDASLAGDIK